MPLEHLTRLKASSLWKLRIGDYREIIAADTEAQEVNVIKIRPRKNIYKS